MVLRSVLRHAARARYALVMQAPGVRAADVPVVRGGGEGAVQVLLLGSGVTSGWGVATHGLALTGLLQRELQVRLGVPCDVELVGDEVMNARTAAAWLGDRGRRGWDAVVVAIGATDAARLTGLKAWEQDVTALLQQLSADLPAGVPLLVAGVPPMESIAPHRWLLTPLIVRHGLRMNAVTERVVAAAGRATYVSMPAKATQGGRPWGSPEAYRPWADGFAAALLAVLPTDRTSTAEPSSRGLRPLTETLMAGSYAGGEPRLQALVQEASVRFGAGLAAINLLDGDRAWIAADSVGLRTKSLPRELTYCDVTVREGELTVPDLRRDPRFRGNELLEFTGLRSYAGVAVHAVDGEAIGTLCLFNGRIDRGVDMAALHLLARQVEVELARVETAGPGAVRAPEGSGSTGSTNAR